ncbi:hypothetical protein FSP39_015509 [Pinctada imbricata]|uniref:UDP-galactopyranose mutase C-terminal domain-containing protein n=1 Tax=Pinctada imbricata TaxID=66713 RepID=A0AA88Y4Q6_PINIB|nr:hypothetical protein FSP39_015509 [Pinctada imbricata]
MDINEGVRNTIRSLPPRIHLCYQPRSQTDIQRGQVVGALSSLKRFGQGPSWSPVVTVSRSASFKNALVQDYHITSHTMSVDVCIVGAGLSGAVIANRYANETNKKVLVLDSRDHIGGNCYDYVNKYGVRMNKYGAHLFHTKRRDVWDFISQFGTWEPWEHRTLAKVYTADGPKHVPIPICIPTVQQLYDPDVKTEQDMLEFFKNETKDINFTKPYKNSEESTLARFGRRIYESFFRDYTIKQWDKSPERLDASVLERIPLRLNYDDRYFTDEIQMLPSSGYTSIFEDLLDHSHIQVLLGVDYLKHKECFKNIQTTIFTGPIDGYFADYNYKKLEYRSLNFKEENVELERDDDYVLPASVVNEPSMKVKYTRTVEYKHFLQQKAYTSTLVREYSSSEGDPYYPVPNDENRGTYKAFQELAETETARERRRVCFLGRLANYKYMNMDQAIGNALDHWEDWKRDWLQVCDSPVPQTVLHRPQQHHNGFTQNHIDDVREVGKVA